jgi:hypothetical protein
VKNWVVALFLGNLIDTVATAFVLANGIATEYNPVVGYLYRVHPYLFLTVKSLALGAALFVAWTDHKTSHIRLTLIAVTVFYGALSLYQVVTLTWWILK